MCWQINTNLMFVTHPNSKRCIYTKYVDILAKFFYRPWHFIQYGTPYSTTWRELYNHYFPNKVSFSTFLVKQFETALLKYFSTFDKRNFLCKIFWIFLFRNYLANISKRHYKQFAYWKEYLNWVLFQFQVLKWKFSWILTMHL